MYRSKLSSLFFDEIPWRTGIVLVLFLFALGVGAFLAYPGYATDWRYVFHPVSARPWNPYSIKGFVNPPWVALILYPISFFSEAVSLAINAGLNMAIFTLLILKRRGNLFSLLLTLTSLPFLSLLANGSIEWIPALGFVLQGEIGMIFLLGKPQSGVLAAWVWLRERLMETIFVLMGVGIVSFLVWGNWIEKALENVKGMPGMSEVNVSLFPWSIPIGVVLIIYLLKHKSVNAIDDEILAVLATLCIAPYFVPHSLSILFALLSISHQRIASVAWFLLWLYPVLWH